MRQAIAAAALLTAVAAAPAAAQKVQVHYDNSADFTTVRTFAWAPTPEVSVKDTSPQVHSRIKNAIEYHLTKIGLVEDPDDPDVYVTYYGESEEEVELVTTHYGYSYGPGWGWGPYWGGGVVATSATTEHTYEVGTLIVDIWDAERKEAIWRGIASDTIPTDPERKARLIDRAVTRMIASFERTIERAQRAEK